MVSRITSIILVVLILIGVPLFIMALGAEEETGKADPILYGIYVYFALAAIVTLFGSITGILANPKGLKSIAIGLVGMLIVIGLAWTLSTGSDYDSYGIESLTEGAAHMSGMFLYMIYILTIGAIGSVLFAGVFRFIK